MAVYATPKLLMASVNDVVDDIVLGGCHAVSTLQRWGGSERCDVHCHFPEGTECGKAHRVCGVIATRDPRLIFFGKEAGAMEDADPDVDNVVVGDGILGEIRIGGAAK